MIFEVPASFYVGYRWYYFFAEVNYTSDPTFYVPMERIRSIIVLSRLAGPLKVRNTNYVPNNSVFYRKQAHFHKFVTLM